MNIKSEDAMKLSCRQLDLAQENPKEMAKMLDSKSGMRRGFNQVTHQLCYALAKGQLSFLDAKSQLEMRLSIEFKDSPRNRKRRQVCQKILSDFYDFLQEEKLSCVLNHSLMKIKLSGGNAIEGHGCAIFKNHIGTYKGVILTDKEFNYGSTLRLPVEQYWIAQKLRLSSMEDVEIFIYYTNDSSYQAIRFNAERIDYVLKKSNDVIALVESEMKKSS